jgi:hypothetical protein
MSHELTDYFVLDMLANDLESIEDILRMLNGPIGWRDLHPEAFSRGEVVAALLRCIRLGAVIACVPDKDGTSLVDAGEQIVPPGSLDIVWFRLTPRGKMLHGAWEPPSSMDG